MTRLFGRALALLLSVGALWSAGAALATPRFVFSPYKHLAQGRGDGHVIRDAGGAPYAQPGRPALTWAFATGECGSEVWGEESADDVARANVAAFDAARVNYIISTGGQGGVFTCTSDAGMDRFITRYASAHLIGVDFDIEAGQSAAQIEGLVQRAKNARAKWPTLRFSFTVATFAAADGSQRSLNPTGEMIMAAIRKVGLDDYVLNLMVMDYGVPEPKACVVKAGQCDMGASALQAVRNVSARYGVPLANIEVTPMIGVNDTANNDFTVADARAVAAMAKSLNLAGVHYWSLDRDQPCARPAKGASPTCSGLLDAAAGAYLRELSQASK
ncbi:glycosyl hydrolase [Massilia arenosa]|uniref:Glycosyl hydrolase n=1 Tax=Zemynaea arenosa TaxID=2561931 RepID=A0A4Y9S321_9BURK|nr:glycosyl hydrolase [Massilia arenosa]TFW15742.1 glycosyl hydrolase [Massilia arenosa]